MLMLTVDNDVGGDVEGLWGGCDVMMLCDAVRALRYDVVCTWWGEVGMEWAVRVKTQKAGPAS